MISESLKQDIIKYKEIMNTVNSKHNDEIF
jgi:hypothetical protein